MKNTVQSYLKRTKKQDEPQVNVDTTNTEEDIEDMMFPPERPNKVAPVPHTMHPGSNRTNLPNKVANESTDKNANRISKNETNNDSKAATEVSDNTVKRIPEKVRESSLSLNPHFGEELEITVNKSDNEDELIPISDFNNDSPIKNTEEGFDFASLANTDIELEYKEQRKSTPVKLSYNLLNMEDSKDDEAQNKNLQRIMNSKDNGNVDVTPKFNLYEELQIPQDTSKRRTSFLLQPRDAMYDEKDIKISKKVENSKLDQQAKKLIDTVIKTQIELEKEKKRRSTEKHSYMNSPSSDSINLIQNSPISMPFSNSNSNESPDPNKQIKKQIEHSSHEEIRRSKTGDEMHMAPFKKKELEKTGGADKLPHNDNLAGIRNTKEYEENIEKLHVEKHLTLQQFDNIRKSFAEKISEKRKMSRSNSDKFLNMKSPRNVESKKRRHSINKKFREEDFNLMVNDFCIKGTDGLLHTGFVLPESPNKAQGKFAGSNL